jgi:hypothetical protein
MTTIWKSQDIRIDSHGSYVWGPISKFVATENYTLKFGEEAVKIDLHA